MEGDEAIYDEEIEDDSLDDDIDAKLTEIAAEQIDEEEDIVSPEIEEV